MANVVNLSFMIGDRYFGMRSALAALFEGVSDIPHVQGALRGMGTVASGLITATGLRLIGNL